MTNRDSLLRSIAYALLLIVISHIGIRTAAVLVDKAQVGARNG